jgi:hypothetical protein
MKNTSAEMKMKKKKYHWRKPKAAPEWRKWQ